MSPSPELTALESVWISERFYRRCYLLAVDGMLVMCAVGVILAYVDGHSGRAATIGVAAALGALAACARGRAGYQWLREHPTTLALAGPLAVVTALWPGVDENALYFPVLGPLAMVACVASHRREAFGVIASLAAGTCFAAVLDTHSPAFSGAAALTTATSGVLVSGILLTIVATWSAIWILDEARATPADMPRSGLASAATPSPAPPTHRLSPSPPILLPARVTAAERSRNRLPDDAAQTNALWIVAIRDKIVTASQGARRIWIELTGFRARELQILLLRGDGYRERDIAALLSLKPSSVRTYTKAAVGRHNNRERTKEAAPVGTLNYDWRGAADIARELAARYPTPQDIHNLAARADPDRNERERGSP